MTRRRPGNIPLSRWLTSANPDLREKAETLLYHLGPDAGAALLNAAEEESRYGRQWRVLFLFPIQILFAFIFFYAARFFSNVQPVLLYALLWIAVGRSLYELAVDTASRRNRLKVIALALAKRNDLRSIGPLIEVWRPIGIFRQRAADDDVEHELERLLPIFMNQGRLTLRNDKFRLLRHKALDLVRHHHYVFQDDLSDSRAELLVLMMQLMARMGGERNRATLRRLAHIPAARPNVQLVREAAEVLQDKTLGYAPATTTVPPTQSGNSATAPPYTALPAASAPPVQTLGARRRP